MNAKKNGLLIIVIFSCFYSLAQSNPNVVKIKDFAIKYLPRGYDSSVHYINLKPHGSLNYLYPLYQLFKEENKFRELLTDNGYYENFAEAFAFLDDYESALEYHQKKYEELDDASVKQIKKAVSNLKNIQQVDAKTFISYLSKNYQVIMINEAHDKPLHRVFVMSLLEELYKKGYRYLCMEMLNNFNEKSIEHLTSATGYYSNEPVAGELIRKALRLGFKLVPYEDTAAAEHTPSERDAVQARNIYKIIQGDTSAKILVLASYGHIAKRSLDSSYIPMGLAFKRLSGIDPLCIDQTDMTEGGEIAFGKELYQDYVNKFIFSTPSIALYDDAPVNITNNYNYDLIVVHPPTHYRDGRPSWLAFGGERIPVYIKPTVEHTFLVQAYYLSETKLFGPGQLVPADQTYIESNKGNYLFYLRKGKYLVTFRDISYRLIGKLNIEVN